MKYTEEEILKWAEEYKRCFNFREVARRFGVNREIVGEILRKNKKKYGIITNVDLIKIGLRRCSVCKKVKIESLFGSHHQKSRCKKCMKKISAEYRKNNIDKCLVAERKWYNKNKAKKAAYKKEYLQRIKNNIEYKLKKRLRGRIREAIKFNKKVGSPIKDLGCSLGELKTHLENQFYPHPITGEEMTWENYGYNGWHIDHIKPLVGFNLENRMQFLEACNYKNLQPLWYYDHKKKSKKDIKKKTGVRNEVIGCIQNSKDIN